MTAARPRCSEESLGRDEPLQATASLVSAWLLIEQPGAWGPDALLESSFPTAVAEKLQSRASGVRILVIRRRKPSPDGPVFFLAHSGAGDIDPFLRVAPLPDPSAVLDVDLGKLAAGETGPGKPVERPVFLVCTHGRHDICCADKGRPLYRAMSRVRPRRTWEVSHLGGDRFAGNLLALPRGDYFGRLEPEQARAFVEAYEGRRLVLDHHRGRSIHPRLVQAADHFLREKNGWIGFDDLSILDYTRVEHDHAEVTFETPLGPMTVSVSAHRESDVAYLTCRAEEPGNPVRYEAATVV